MLAMGQQHGRIRKMALQGDPFTPNAYLRVLPPDGTRPARLAARTFGEIEPTQEIFLQRSGYPHPGSPQAPVAYKCQDGLPPTELVDLRFYCGSGLTNLTKSPVSELLVRAIYSGPRARNTFSISNAGS